MFAKSSKMIYSSKHSNFAIFLRGNMMDEMHKLMQEHEQFLEEALEAMECGWPTQDQIACIRQACGKPRNNHVHPLLRDMVNDFATIFGGHHA